MSTNSTFDNLARAWLDEGPTQLSDFALDAALDEVHLTRQRRAPRVSWRFPHMPALTRATGIAAVALVAAVGVGGIYLASNPGGVGSEKTPAPTVSATVTPSLPPGIPGWTTYTSAVYGFTMQYPSDWSVDAAASQRWPAGRDNEDGWPYAELFLSPAADDQIAMLVWEIPARTSLSSRGAMNAAFPALCEAIGAESCEPPFAPKTLCLGPLGFREGEDGLPCWPALFAPVGDVDGEIPHAFVGDWERDVVTVFVMAREDSFPAAQKYGGTEALLKAIVGQLDVGGARPGETPR